MTRAILLMGPTATGKTDLALEFATQFPIEIISVDSALIYRGMDIGTAKPSKFEQQQVAHHLIDIIEPIETYSVAQFIDDSVSLIHEINKRGKIPLLVGGTMLYYNGLLNGLSELPVTQPEVRALVEAEGTELGWERMHDKLKHVDPIAAAKIMPADRQRISRALEVYYQTGIAMSALQLQSKAVKSEGVEFLSLGIIPEHREVLHQRIAKRFNKMLAGGFIEEVEHLRNSFPDLTSRHNSMRSVGYSQVWQYLDNLIDKYQLYDKAVAATRQLAKRQITWLRNMDIINLVANDDLNFNSIYSNLLKNCREQFISDKVF